MYDFHEDGFKTYEINDYTNVSYFFKTILQCFVIFLMSLGINDIHNRDDAYTSNTVAPLVIPVPNVVDHFLYKELKYRKLNIVPKDDIEFLFSFYLPNVEIT